MRRREFLRALSGLAVLRPLAVRAQQGEHLRRIGILMPFAPEQAEPQQRVQAFKEELRKRGWAAGINVQFEERWTADNMDLIRSAAADLVALTPEAILAVGGRVIPILMKLTRTIPIINPGGSDPVERGYADSLAHPGHNVTGFATMEISIIGKMLQVLKEIAPNVKHVTMIFNPDNRVTPLFARIFESAAAPLGIEPATAQIHNFRCRTRRCENGGKTRRRSSVPAGYHHRIAGEPGRCGGRTQSASGYLLAAQLRAKRRTDLLWCRSPRPVSRLRHLRRPYSARREGWRSTLPAADQIRAGDQHEGRQGTRPVGPAATSIHRRRGRRIDATRARKYFGFPLLRQ